MRMLITAGPTREPIDAVRFIGNRSSGKMGLALARAAMEAGHEVTLLLGPVPGGDDLPAGCRVYRFETAAELKQVLGAHWPDYDVLLMAAAVGDYRPMAVVEGKIPRTSTGGMTLVLEPTPDLVALMSVMKKPRQRIVAFALEEPEHLEERAAVKLRQKHVDAIVANPLDTMDADAITPLWLTADGERETPGRMGKAQFAQWLVKKVTDGLGR